MKIGALIICFAAWCCSLWGQTSGKNAAFESYGYGHTTQNRQDVDKAIGLANDTLSASVGLKLEDGWDYSGQKSNIPVYVVGSAMLSKEDKIFVPEGERFIIVNATCLKELPVIFHETGYERTNATIPVGLPGYLSIIFLHELGHIALRHPGSHSALPESLDEDLNVMTNKNKLTELAADKWAADQIRQSPPIESLDVHLALEHIIWNMTVWRSIEHFGSSIAYSPDVYWDVGTTHPNLMFRILIIADLVKTNSFAHDMIDQFVTGRKRQPWSKTFTPIKSIAEVNEIATKMGYLITEKRFPDRVSYEFDHPKLGIHFIVYVRPGLEIGGMREIAQGIGLEF